MAKGWDLSKFSADMMNNMLVASIRRKMKEDVGLKKFAESENCSHIALDPRKVTEDRDLEIFSDDLFKYLLLRRLKITEYRSYLKRTLEDPISNFHPHIGLLVLYCSYFTQKNIFLEILENKVSIQNLGSIASYYNKKVVSIHSLVEFNVFQKLRILASLTLELSTFCYLQGSRNVIYFGAKLFLCAFQDIFKKDFFDNGGWNAWQNVARIEIKYYEEKLREIPVIYMQMINSEWLERYDRWIARLPLQTCNQIQSTMTGNESANQSCNVKNYDATCHSMQESGMIPDNLESETKEALKCLFLKDCPTAKKFQNMSNNLILELITIISREKDSAYEELCLIIETDTSVKKLMRYCILTRLVIQLKASKIKMRNTDILQCVKLILQDNAHMAAFCSHLAIKTFQELDKAKSFMQKDSEETILDRTAENLNLQETNSNIESVERLPPKNESRSSVYQEHKNLLDRFLDKIKPNGKHSTSYASEICEILSNKAKAEILLTFDAFIKLMKQTVTWSGNRWEDEWILSIMTLVINNSQTKYVFRNRSTVDGAHNTEHLANKVSVVHTNPQQIKSTQSSVHSIFKCEDIGNEPACDDINTEQVENLHQNVLTLNLCEQCFNCVNEKLRLVKYYPATEEISIPEKENSVERRKKKRTLKKQKGSVNCEISVPIETSSTTETAVADLQLIDLYSEDSSKDIKQTHYTGCETNNTKKQTEKFERLGNFQLDKYRDCNDEFPFSPEDNSGRIHEASDPKETSSTTETPVADLLLIDLYSEVDSKEIKQIHYTGCETNNTEKQTEKVARLGNFQPDKYRDCNDEFPFSPEDNSGTIHEASDPKETSSTTETAVADLLLIDLYSEVDSKEIKQTHYTGCETNNTKKQTEKVERLSSSQFDSYRDCNDEFLFSPEDNSGTIHETQSEGETNVGEVISLSEISSV